MSQTPTPREEVKLDPTLNWSGAIMPGTLVYLDTFAGLLPAKVVACHDLHHATVKLTADRGAWRRGERIFTEARYAVPRTLVYQKKRKTVIVNVGILAYPAPGKEYTPAEERA